MHIPKAPDPEKENEPLDHNASLIHRPSSCTHRRSAYVYRTPGTQTIIGARNLWTTLLNVGLGLFRPDDLRVFGDVRKRADHRESPSQRLIRRQCSRETMRPGAARQSAESVP